MNTPPSRARCFSITALSAALFLSAGCTRMLQSWSLRDYDRNIQTASEAIQSAKNDAQRAAAYSSRGDAYSEKSRYSRTMKLIANEEYDRLFDLAIQDHNQAITLDSENPELYFRRGYAYYWRGSFDRMKSPKATTYLTLAKADFSKTIEKSQNNARAYDMLGVVDSSLGDWTQAIADFTQEAALDPRSRYRIPDAYCNRGSVYLGEKKYDLAVSDLNQAIEMQAPADPCDCEPYNPLLAVYLTGTHEYDKARAIVAKAQTAKKWIAPEYLQQLKSLNR